ncbi:uncharacterized protein LOC133806439 [Humulus lupulus]|uniref:uncharacterized protein LOC133806439 n=1 Tax=Humulus lupulus TaxID=3486 RepID=UPI002B407F42|nr:uncharacterized protein LOC133806439 [Humulus lupulus]
MYERFQKQHPPKFDGSTDPTIVEDWMCRMRSIMNFMRVTGNDRVVCATHIFRKDARIWWEVIEQTIEVNLMTWKDFCEVFNNKFYNEAVRATKIDEFTVLSQGNMTVAEYAQKFDRLAKFAADLILTNRVRKYRFVRGLKLMITRDIEMVSTGGIVTYAQALDQALIAE